MAKADTEKEPKAWTPDQPLEDEEDEKETQRKARATVRLNHLTKEFETAKEKEKHNGKRSLW